MSDNNPVFAFASYQIRDFDAFLTNYAHPVGEALASIGAEIMSASAEPDVREGRFENNFSTLLKFPSAEAFNEFYTSSTYRALKNVRESLTDGQRSQFYVLPKFAATSS